jgi:hypothetical protein
MTDTTFCCEQMRRAVEDPDVPLIYTAKFDEFGVRVLDGGSSTIALEYCPWSGDKLPSSLRDAWFKELDRLGLDPLSSDLPAELADERWYRK